MLLFRSNLADASFYLGSPKKPMSAKKILTLKIAKQFLADNHSVRIGAYKSIEDDAAAALATYKGGLDLSGLGSLDAAAARALGRHKGPLDLSGLESLSDPAAKHLSEHKAPLYLSGLRKLSPHAAACLAANHDTVLPFILRPEAAAGALEVQGERHSTKRPAIRSKQLKALQIVLPVKKRPVHQIRKQPKLVKQFHSHIAELRQQCETALDRAAFERLKSCLESSPKPCESFHFPLPDSVDDSLPQFEWEETCNYLHEWAARELDALDTCFVDVENLTESCNECIGFTSRVFRHRRYVKEEDIANGASLNWRCIGDEIGVMMTNQTDQYEVPPHELSDLFNRALPPGRAMVYFDMEANGLYVLMETKGMESRLSKVLAGKAASTTPRTPRKPRDPEPDSESDSEAPEGHSWLNLATALDPKVEIFHCVVKDLTGESSQQSKGARLCVDQLSVKAAELLASFPGGVLEIRFRGPISDEAAAALAGFQGSQLELSGISNLTETAIKTLLSSKRSYLAIVRDVSSMVPNRASDIDIATARAGTIAVDFPLSDACLKKLSAFKSDQLFLKGITNLSDAGAKSLSSFKGTWLRLNGLTDLSEAGAAAIAACRCEKLSLDGLKSLTPAVAAALATSRCTNLDLNGVESISDSAAEALSAFLGKKKLVYTNFKLSLNGVGALSDAAANSLAKTKVHSLSLAGLKKVSEVGLSNLAKVSSLKLGIEHISDAAAISFGKVRRHALYLDALTEISDKAITEIAPSIDHTLSLCGIRKLSVPAAQVLASFLFSEGHYPTGYGCLFLDGLETLSVAVAEELAKTTATLHLNGVIILGDAEAKALAKHEGGLCLNGLTNLSDIAAEELAKYSGDLMLCGLESLSDAAAKLFSKPNRDLGLSGLKSLSDVAAKSLAKYAKQIDPAPADHIFQRILKSSC